MFPGVFFERVPSFVFASWIAIGAIALGIRLVWNRLFFRWKSPFRLLLLCWVILLLYGQLGVHFVHSCRFSGGGVRLLIVADPQLTDRFSYDVSPFLNWVIGFFCDLQLRMSWKAAVWRADPDAAVFLGDMLWGGFLFSRKKSTSWVLPDSTPCLEERQRIRKDMHLAQLLDFSPAFPLLLCAGIMTFGMKEFV